MEKTKSRVNHRWMVPFLCKASLGFFVIDEMVIIYEIKFKICLLLFHITMCVYSIKRDYMYWLKRDWETMYDQSMTKDRIRNLTLGTRLYQFFLKGQNKRKKKERPKLFFFKTNWGTTDHLQPSIKSVSLFR